MKKGLKAFGEDGVEAVLVELQQLHDRKVLEPQDASKMTREERHASLNYLMFLKKKRSGKIKGRGCADGRKQRIHTKKEDASSPTVAIEAVMLSCVIDAEEERDVAIIDIPGAFMQVDMDEIQSTRTYIYKRIFILAFIFMTFVGDHCMVCPSTNCDTKLRDALPGRGAYQNPVCSLLQYIYIEARL
jgi:hypothetical protein